MDFDDIKVTPTGEVPLDAYEDDYDYDDDDIPEVDLPQTDMIPDERPRKDGPGGEGN